MAPLPFELLTAEGREEGYRCCGNKTSPFRTEMHEIMDVLQAEEMDAMEGFNAAHFKELERQENQ